MHPLSKHQSLHKPMLLPPKLTAGTQARARVNGNGGKNSLVWNHFEKGKVENDVTKAICNYCQKFYHIDSKSYGTSNLLAYVSQHVSTISSEPTFLMKECIIDPFRSSLPPLMVQNLVCAQNWLLAIIPISHRQSMDEVEALEEEFHDLGYRFKF